MKIFFGAAIQGSRERGERAPVYRAILDVIQSLGHSVFSEHTGARTQEENTLLLRRALGTLPDVELERRIYVRNRMIEFIESPNLDAAIFEVSTPSLGTGIELAHAYLRPRLGLKSIPLLVLYQTNYWPHQLSTMIRGITPETVPQLNLREYGDIEDAKNIASSFLSGSK